jgi:replicative superfamily II helicase
MPLLWPAAAAYADQALPGPDAHAVIAVPTGAGKSSVAELAIAQAVRTGWVLYLAPTNALVAQARRDLRRSIGHLDGVSIRTFTGGAEYTRMSGETLELTPEKCSLALAPEPGGVRVHDQYLGVLNPVAVRPRRGAPDRRCPFARRGC